MNESPHDQDRQLIEVLVQTIARQAIQIRPSGRYAFVMGQVDKIQVAYEAKYGPHPNPTDLERKLQAWVSTMMRILEGVTDKSEA